MQTHGKRYRVIAVLMAAILFIPVFGMGVGAVDLSSPSYQPGNNIYAWGQCTWYVWGRVNEVFGIRLPGFGNAIQWYDNARAAGYSVGQTPQAHSIAVCRSTLYPQWGHVVFVESLSGETMHISEGNYMGQDYHERDMSIYDSSIIGYIYLSGAPVVTPSLDNTSIEFVTDSDAKVHGNVSNPAGSKIGLVGMNLWEYGNPTPVKHYEEWCAAGHEYDRSLHMWFDIQAECGFTLSPGTLYEYQLFAVVGGETCYGDKWTFTTAGDCQLKYLWVTASPSRSEYFVYEPAVITDLAVTAGYSNGTTQPIDRYSTSYEPGLGEKTVTIRYEGLEASLTLNFTRWMGDVDHNETINPSDALGILQHSVGLVTLMGDDGKAADVDFNGAISPSDALKVLQYSVNLIFGF